MFCYYLSYNVIFYAKENLPQIFSQVDYSAIYFSILAVFGAAGSSKMAVLAELLPTSLHTIQFLDKNASKANK